MKDLTVVAIPFYFGSMGLEYRWLRDRDDPEQALIGFERRDTVASLTMGVASLVAPLVVPKMLQHITPGKGKHAKALVGTALGAAAVTVAADLVAKSALARRPRLGKVARRVASAGSVTAVVAGGVAVTTTWGSRLTLSKLWRHRILPDLGTGPKAMAAAIVGWDFIYYWNHRLMHTSRCMWAIHVVHHSSERYNLSTALRQPVADSLGAFVPYSLLCLLGIQPRLIGTARGVNLLYQYWIHTEAIGKLGQLETTLNTPSHHRVHHGSNGRYLDRNHGSILIVWDRLFGTFEPESDRVLYGLTKNINSFSPVKIVAHEYLEMLRDVARSDNWHDRLSFVLRGPGWAGRRRRELESQP